MSENVFSKLLSKMTWDRGGAVRKAIQDGYGHPPAVAAHLGMTVSEMLAKHSMFRKDIEAAMKDEREAVLRMWNESLSLAVLEWLVEASNGTRLPDGNLAEAVRAHMLFVLRGKPRE